MTEDALKPGYTTTEFYGVIANQIVQLALPILAMVHPGFHLTPDGQALLTALTTTFASVGSFVGWIVYTNRRHTLKLAAIMQQAAPVSRAVNQLEATPIVQHFYNTPVVQDAQITK